MSKENKDIKQDSRIHYPVRLLSLEGACRYLSCSGDLLEDLIAMDCFPIVRLGKKTKLTKKDRRKRWVDRIDLDKFIEERKHYG